MFVLLVNKVFLFRFVFTRTRVEGRVDDRVIKRRKMSSIDVVPDIKLRGKVRRIRANDGKLNGKCRWRGTFDEQVK